MTTSPSSSDTHNHISGIGVDTIYIDVDLQGAPASIEIAPTLEGFFQSVDKDWKWAIKHRTLKNLWVGASRDIMVNTRGRCMSGLLRVRLSVAELLSSMKGEKGNLGQASPARLADVLATILEDLGDALHAPGLAARAVITRLDVFADVFADIRAGHAGQALAIFKDRMVCVSKRAARHGKSFQVGDNLTHISFNRRKGKGRQTEPTIVYDKAAQLGRDDLTGLVRLECVLGTGKRSEGFLSIAQACDDRLWRELLADRLRELGLTKEVKIKAPSDVQTAALALIKDGIPPAQAALYALQSLDPSKVLSGEKKLSRALRDNRKNVEARTRLRLSSARPDPQFIADLWDIIENFTLENPKAGPVPYDDDVSLTANMP